MRTATFPDPATLSDYDIRQYDLAYQHTINEGYTLSAAERAHFAAIVAEYVAREERALTGLLPHELEELAG